MGPNPSPWAIKLLGSLNESRGRSSTGLYSVDGSFLKDAKKATDFLLQEDVVQYIHEKQGLNGIMLHTRAPTTGAATKDNAHPFKYGDVVGAHNGTIINAPRTYPVDSMWAMHLLSEHKPGRYQEALGDLDGYFVLVWYDGRDNAVYLLNWKGSLAISEYEPNIFYSSTVSDCHFVSGVKPPIDTKSGDVFRFTPYNGKFVRLKDFVGKEPSRSRPTAGWQRYHTYQPTRYTGTVAYKKSNFLNAGYHWYGETIGSTDPDDQWKYITRQDALIRMFPNPKKNKHYKLDHKQKKIVFNDWELAKVIISDKEDDYIVKDDDPTVIVGPHSPRELFDSDEDFHKIVKELLVDDVSLDEDLDEAFDGDKNKFNKAFWAIYNICIGRSTTLVTAELLQDGLNGHAQWIVSLGEKKKKEIDSALLGPPEPEVIEAEVVGTTQENALAVVDHEVWDLTPEEIREQAWRDHYNGP